MEYVPISICALRLAKVDASGAPVSGAHNGYQSTAPQQLQAGVNISTGTDIDAKDGCGRLRASLKDPDKLKNAALTLDLCVLDAALKTIAIGGDAIGGITSPIGHQFAHIADVAGAVCTEAWVKAMDGSAQAVDASTSPDVTYFHFVWPNVTWQQASDTFNGTAFGVDQITGVGIENPSMGAAGPFGDWPAEVQALPGGGVSAVGAWFYDTLPFSTDGLVAVTGTGS